VKDPEFEAGSGGKFPSMVVVWDNRPVGNLDDSSSSSKPQEADFCCCEQDPSTGQGAKGHCGICHGGGRGENGWKGIGNLEADR